MDTCCKPGHMTGRAPGGNSHQSYCMQLTKAGNLRARMRNLSPTGLKHRTTCRFCRTCGEHIKIHHADSTFSSRVIIGL